MINFWIGNLTDYLTAAVITRRNVAVCVQGFGLVFANLCRNFRDRRSSVAHLGKLRLTRTTSTHLVLNVISGEVPAIPADYRRFVQVNAALSKD